MLQIAEVEDLRGRHVIGSDGARIGKIDEVYLDDQSGQPEWALVNTGLFGLRSSFVLLTGATADGDDIVVPFDKATVKDAPSIDPDGALSPQEEATLFSHYGRDDYEAGAPAAAAAPSADEPTGAADADAGPSASLAAARIEREAATGHDATAVEGIERTQDELDEERRGPEGPTGRTENEDPVPPDGGPPPRQDHEAAPGAAGAAPAAGEDGFEVARDDVPKPPGAPDGHEDPTAAGVPKPAGAPDVERHRGEHWEDEALSERGNATATPEHGPTHEPSERDALEAPESPDASGPGGTTTSGRSRLRKYVSEGSGSAEGPGAPDPSRDH